MSNFTKTAKKSCPKCDREFSGDTCQDFTITNIKTDYNGNVTSADIAVTNTTGNINIKGSASSDMKTAISNAVSNKLGQEFQKYLTALLKAGLYLENGKTFKFCATYSGTASHGEDGCGSLSVNFSSFQTDRR